MGSDEPVMDEPVMDEPVMDEPMPDPGAVGDSVSGIEATELEMLRQLCVDEINMYRATLSLPPLPRATPEQELCSDRGAQKDGDSERAHGSAGQRNPCAAEGNSPNFAAQNTCPGYPVGGFRAATIADALTGCLAQMWAEGMPPIPISECMADQSPGGCFLTYGHWINMQSDHAAVSCGFYRMADGRIWMNQDFVSNFSWP
jgi:hypothetical protein